VGVLWPPGCYKCILIGAAHSSRLKLCSSALLAFHCLRPRHRMPSYPPAPQLPSHRVSSKMGKRENYIEDFCLGWWGLNYHLFTVCVILIKLLGGTVKRVKKGRGSQKKCRSIDFNSIFQYISQEQQNPVSGERLWILRLPHVTHSLIGRGSLIRWRASFVNVKGILSAPQLRPPPHPRAPPTGPIQIHASVQGRFGGSKVA